MGWPPRRRARRRRPAGLAAARSRTHRRRVRTAAAIAVAALLVLPAEAVRTATRTYLPADSAPLLHATYGTGPQLRLVLIGDSTAAGIGASATATSVGGRLAAGLAGARTVQLSSVAISGSRTPDLAPQVVRALAGPRPDLAVVLIGANDATHLARLDAVRRDLRAALARLHGAGVAVVVGSCPDLGGARAFPQPLRLVAAWQGRRVAAAERAAAAGTGATVVDLAARTGPAFRADPRTLAADRFHPSDRGYALWAAALLPAVRAAAGRLA